MRPDVQDKILSIIAREAAMEPAEVRPDMTLDELGLDSLGLVEMIFAIEETFGVSVPFNANEPTQGEFDISSVGAIVRAVERLISGPQAALA
ncbi:acyl carrier protein [Rhodobacter capsulatus]|jgi:acyl carrier protein|uniref:Acyl carrier protein-2 n=1 Tax=Rhodobacter capsulatus (strain ATCC BAA-309 / NBRC 16581 / SB1003) TaxID=272942 RepID=D5AUH7_RHOCB|nr:acyl carrier protein [Rhodobacter capsulatus]ADE85616.1 acyl carrier protein-2 [Rhodobacter capsulatus SB 1003]ETD01646.1 phosphopantetheine-binding protein [Rhodobacter capsulatus DE442]ETD76713.1 phosphopantetheine-binding protein [Rhodobacter capsulatus R121]ETD84431.1 phosphopantetheine-binding protein [Rhodobacter capsulatus YW1]ETD85950.1 phosphopantetheine-binding protein [Rhodobacter capsulatus B6]